MMMRPRTLIMLLVLPALMLTGCTSGDRFADIKQRMEEIRRKPKGAIKPPPEFKTYENFIYSASLLRSPFQPPVEEEPVEVKPKGKQVKPDFNRPKEILESFSIESLTMVGTITRPGEELYALIKDNQGGVHRVTENNYMGRNHGKILNITPTKIELVELIPDGQDGWVERPRTIVLRDE